MRGGPHIKIIHLQSYTCTRLILYRLLTVYTPLTFVQLQSSNVQPRTASFILQSVLCYSKASGSQSVCCFGLFRTYGLIAEPSWLGLARL